MKANILKTNKTLGLILLVISLMLKTTAYSQSVAINTTGAAANSSAMLEVSSTNSGILIPRMTQAQKLAINSPAAGLMIYQIDGVTGFWYYNGSLWVQAIGPTGPAGSAASCPAAGSNETLIYFNGCLYVKNIDETGTYTWADAQTKCASLGSGWYLPDRMELDVVYQNWNQPSGGGTCQGGSCPLTGFNNTSSGYYWSSTVSYAGNAWRINFYADGVDQTSNTTTCNVRCVRR